MKFAIFALFIAGQAFGATRTIDISVPAALETSSSSSLTICTYDTKLNFSSFPDFEVFSQIPKTNNWTKDNNGGHMVNTTVEIQDDHTYVLHLQPMPEFPDAGQACDAKNIKVLVRE